MGGPVTDPSQVYQQMEAAFLRQMMSASGAFKPSEVAGGQIRADLFISTLADAIAKGGGIGIAKMLEDSLSPAESADAGDVGDPGDPAATAAKTSSHAPSRTPSSMHAAHGSAADLSKPPGAVTSGFGPRIDPIDGTSKYHTGVDLRAAEGSPILAAGAGVVRNAGPRGGYGNAVEVDHGGGVTTLYGHASELLVKAGEKVSEGQPIARVGQTGRATGPHLHFEVRMNDRPVNPMTQPGASSNSGVGSASASPGASSAKGTALPIFVNRALNAYRNRTEDSTAGRPSPSRGGESP
jgi:murein DD-endopeptidase MepM/ murein hydrolase activator NlpD